VVGTKAGGSSPAKSTGTRASISTHAAAWGGEPGRERCLRAQPRDAASTPLTGGADVWVTTKAGHPALDGSHTRRALVRGVTRHHRTGDLVTQQDRSPRPARGRLQDLIRVVAAPPRCDASVWSQRTQLDAEEPNPQLAAQCSGSTAASAKGRDVTAERPTSPCQRYRRHHPRPRRGHGCSADAAVPPEHRQARPSAAGIQSTSTSRQPPGPRRHPDESGERDGALVEAPERSYGSSTSGRGLR
jgi:hypothetical protein